MSKPYEPVARKISTSRTKTNMLSKRASVTEKKPLDKNRREQII